MSLIQFLRILMARKAIIIATFLSCVLAAYIVTRLLPPRYEAHAKVMLDIVKPDPVTGQMISSSFMRAYMRTQAELIKDIRTAGRVVDQLGWTTDPQIVARFERENGDPGADVRQWLARKITDGTTPLLLDGSNILDIKYVSDSPESARQIAELIRTAYIEQTLEAKREEAGKSADWFRGQTDKAKKALELAETSRTQFARANNIPVQTSSAMDLDAQKLGALNQQSVAAVAMTAPAAAQAAIPIPVSPAQIQLDALDQQIAQAAASLGPNHPTIQTLRRQRSVVASAAARAPTVIRPAGAAAANPASQINQAFEQQRQRVIGNAEKMDQLAQFQRDVDLKRDLYQKAAQRASELRLQADSSDAGITLLGPPSTSDKPSSPDKPMIMITAIGAGLGLGLLLALFVELLNRRIRSDVDLEESADAPVFAVIGETRDPEGLVQKIIGFVDRRKKRDDDGTGEALA